MILKEIERYFNENKEHLTEEEYKAVMDILSKLPQDAPSKRQADEFKKKGDDEYSDCNFRAAIDFYTRAIHHDPENIAYLSSRAAAYSNLGMVEEAIKDYESGLKIDRNAVELYIALGMLYSHKDEDKAYETFGKGLAIDPDNEVLKEKREWLVNKEASKPHNDIEDMFGKINLDNKGVDLNTLLVDENMGDLIKNVIKDKSSEELAEMVKSIMGSMNIPGKK